MYMDWLHVTSNFLLIYAGRSLAELPDKVEMWLFWAWSRGIPASDAADFLSQVRWPGRVTLDANPLQPVNQWRVLRVLADQERKVA